MFVLKDARGAIIRMKSGDPFTYSTEDLAAAGRKALAKHLGMALTIVPFG